MRILMKDRRLMVFSLIQKTNGYKYLDEDVVMSDIDR
jgi:hypothetical protein